MTSDTVILLMYLSIDNPTVEICDNFIYLGITFYCKLKWSNHCTLIVSKCKQRLFFLLLLNSFGVKGALYRIWCGVNRLGDSGVKVV